jgi:nucleotide-binding universal stress UspA family protein
VLIARATPGGARFPESILVAVDDSPQARVAAELGGALAVRHGACVALIAAPQRDEQHRRRLAGHVDAVGAATGTRPLVLDEHAAAGSSIVAAAASMGASLIVTGSRPGHPAASISEQVARDAGCSVLVARPGAT